MRGEVIVSFLEAPDLQLESFVDNAILHGGRLG